jgi:hypothetical protein
MHARIAPSNSIFLHATRNFSKFFIFLVHDKFLFQRHYCSIKTITCNLKIVKKIWGKKTKEVFLASAQSSLVWSLGQIYYLTWSPFTPPVDLPPLNITHSLCFVLPLLFFFIFYFFKSYLIQIYYYRIIKMT